MGVHPANFAKRHNTCMLLWLDQIRSNTDSQIAQIRVRPFGCSVLHGRGQQAYLGWWVLVAGEGLEPEETWAAGNRAAAVPSKVVSRVSVSGQVRWTGEEHTLVVNFNWGERFFLGYWADFSFLRCTRHDSPVVRKGERPTNLVRSFSFFFHDTFSLFLFFFFL